MTRRVRLVISGRVQGVWYRESTRQEAERLGVEGWVRNLPDGRVEALAHGAPEAVDALIAWCRRGPPEAHVTDILIEEAGETDGAGTEANGRGTGFVVRR